jgi:hypothetical protein
VGFCHALPKWTLAAVISKVSSGLKLAKILLGHLNRVELAKECLLHFMRRYSARRVARQDICCGDQRSGNQANGAAALIARISSASASSVFPRNLARTDEPRHALNLCS